MAKKPKTPRANNPARDSKGRFLSGPALEVGVLDKELKTATPQPNTELNKDTTMSKIVPAETTPQSFTERAKGYLTTSVSAITPASLATKLPEGVKSAMDKTPASAVIAGLGVLAYGVYRKFFKKTPTV